MRKDFAPSQGITVYPSASGNRKEGQIGVTPFMRCIQCGMPNDTRRTGWSAQGEGLSDPVSVTVSVAPGQDSSTADTKVRSGVAGCRFCSSMKWRPTKPPILPDDRYKPSSEWYAKRKRR